MVARLRTAVIGDEVSQDLKTVLKLCRKHHFDGVEIRSVWGKSPHELSRGDCLNIRDMVKDAGLAIAGFASRAFKTPLPVSSAELRTARDSFGHEADRTLWLDAPHVRVFSFLRPNRPAPAAAAEAVRAVLAFFEGLPFKVLVETGTTSNTPGGREIRAFLDHFVGTNLGVLWDPGNGVFSGIDLNPYPNSYELLADRLQHVHVKDPLGPKGYTRLGEGIVPWDAILERLRQDGFRGYVSLETHWRRGRTLTAVERDLPWGHRFSRDALIASDECMATLAAKAAVPGARR